MESTISEGTDILKRLWSRLVLQTGETKGVGKTQRADEEVRELSLRGIGTEETLRFLCGSRPNFETFLQWCETITANIAVLPPLTTEGHAQVLTESELKFWDENGYLVVKNVVDEALCSDARSAILDFVGATANDRNSWYTPTDRKNGMMLHLVHHPALDQLRSSVKIRKIYEELYQSEDIYLLVDKCGFNPPVSDSYSFAGSALHWDVSLQLPVPFVLQGLLYLNDVEAGDGAFHCVPGFHRTIDAWVASLAQGANIRAAARDMLNPIPVAGSAGDLVVWHQALPHCATPNTGTSPRMVQYMAYKPNKSVDHDIWI